MEWYNNVGKDITYTHRQTSVRACRCPSCTHEPLKLYKREREERGKEEKREGGEKREGKGREERGKRGEKREG